MDELPQSHVFDLDNVLSMLSKGSRPDFFSSDNLDIDYPV